LDRTKKRYPFLIKYSEDLRKDARFEDCFRNINDLLQTDANAARQNLCICTFAVLPMGETWGLIEWVDQAIPLKDVFYAMYSDRGRQVIGGDIKRKMESGDERTFQDEILPLFPPIFSEWFVEQYQDKKDWLSHRLNYTRTLAVMSIVGYVLGIGDRHLENMMLTTADAGILHVDFDMAFGKGATLQIPEIVPFRLTANLVDGFGLVGHHGSFFSAAVATLRVLRRHRDFFFTVIESFFYDPLQEWEKDNFKQTPARVMAIVEEKLRADDQTHERVVEKLIAEATSIENLRLMYVGWHPFM